MMDPLCGAANAVLAPPPQVELADAGVMVDEADLAFYAGVQDGKEEEPPEIEAPAPPTPLPEPPAPAPQIVYVEREPEPEPKWEIPDDDATNPTPFDYCVVVPKNSEAYMTEIIAEAEAAGFVHDVFESRTMTGDEAVIFCCLRVPRKRYLEYAAAMGCPARLEPNKLAKACASLDPPIAFDRVADLDAEDVEAPASGASKKKHREALSLTDVTKIGGLYPPFLHIYAPVRGEKVAEELYMDFVDHNRHKLLLRMFSSKSDMPHHADGSPADGRGAGLNPREMDECHPFTAVKKDSDGTGPRIASIMLLHDPLGDKTGLRHDLYDTWIQHTSPPWEAPVHKLRLYLGDQCGFYFLFVSMYSTAGLVPGAFGVVIAALTFLFDSDAKQQFATITFAPVIVFFYALFLSRFKQHQSIKAKEWGCFAWTGSKPTVRPTFHGVPQTDPIDGHIVIDWPSAMRTKRTQIAWTVIGVLCLVVLGAIGFVFGLKSWSQRQDGFWGTYGGIIASLINTAQVQILNIVYGGLATFLTGYENWKTDAEYSDNLVAKLFLFKFFNTFGSVCVTAFLMRALFAGGCPGNDCLWELFMQLAMLFMSGAGISFVTTVVLPTLKQRSIYKKIEAAGGVSDGEAGNESPDEIRRAACRRQFATMEEYDNIDGPIGDYMEIALQFGFVVCFGAAFPFSPIVACLVGLMQLKMDAYKLLFFQRRPIPLEVCSIGVWEQIFDYILYFGILTNAGMITITANLMSNWTPRNRVIAWIIVSMLLSIMVKLVRGMHPSMTNAVLVQLTRQEVYKNRVVMDMECEPVFDEAKCKDDSERNTKLVTAVHKDHHKV